MTIVSSFYSNQLPAVCVQLANHTLGALSSYSPEAKQPEEDIVDILENAYRLLEMYRSGNLGFDYSSGVLGLKPELAAEAPSFETAGAPSLYVKRQLDASFRKAFGGNSAQEIEQLEQLLGVVAYRQGPPQDGMLDKAREFFTNLRDSLAPAAMA